MEIECISLGCRCEVAWQLRRRTGKTIAYPFDWLVTPLSSIVPMIEDRFENIANQRYLETSPYRHPFTGEMLETIINTKYDVFLHHDFSRDENGAISKQWFSEVSDVANKWRHISDSWNDLMASRKDIALFRQRGNLSMPLEDNLPTSHNDFEAVADYLRNRRAGRTRFIVIDGGESARKSEAIEYHSIGIPTEDDCHKRDFWRGSISKWDALFEDLALTHPHCFNFDSSD